MPPTKITHPDDAALNELCARLVEFGPALDCEGHWPREQLELCGQYGVFEWFIEPEWGGQGWSEADITRGYLKLSAACLTTTFIITQRSGACRRIAAAAERGLEGKALCRQLLPPLATGETFATIGISQLTTSRQHLKQAALTARTTEGGFALQGYSPWVTGAAHADWLVLGAQLENGEQLLAVVSGNEKGIKGIVAEAPMPLIALSASHTGQVRLEGEVFVPGAYILMGPGENIMQQATGANTGGLQTSTLAVGLTAAAIEYLQAAGEQRTNFLEPAERLAAEHAQLEADLLTLADAPACGLAPEQSINSQSIRTRANSLVLRATQAALAAAKGSGYAVGHPVGRWCREALFFLVWSCPQPVIDANLCELSS